MARHLAVRKKMTIFDYRYYYRRAMAVWIKLKRRIRAKLNHE